MGCIRENGKRPGKKTFDGRNGKPVLLALGTVALVPVKAVRMQSHGSTKDMQLYRQMSHGNRSRQSFAKLTLCETVCIRLGRVTPNLYRKRPGGKSFGKRDRRRPGRLGSSRKKEAALIWQGKCLLGIQLKK